jgi:predicted metal-dependent hydrolase
MRATSKCIWWTVTTSELHFASGGRDWPLVVVRRRGAKAMRLSVDPRDATVRLSLPMRAPLKPALGWAAGKRDWIEAQLAKLPAPQPIMPGMRFLVAGEDVVIDWDGAHPRTPKLVSNTVRAELVEALSFSSTDGQRKDSPSTGSAQTVFLLKVGGPVEQMPARVMRYLKRVALDTLTRETQELAVANNITVTKVGIGDPKSRWGSCASSGDIRYSWRLILAPSYVRRATVAHEVAHRVHMNHSREFHALAATLNGADPRPASRWLRTNGSSLHWFGRGAA